MRGEREKRERETERGERTPIQEPGMYAGGVYIHTHTRTHTVERRAGKRKKHWAPGTHPGAQSSLSMSPSYGEPITHGLSTLAVRLLASDQFLRGKRDSSELVSLLFCFSRLFISIYSLLSLSLSVVADAAAAKKWK